MNKLGIVIACTALFSTGCYWSSQPSTPHRSEKIELGLVPQLTLPSPRPLKGTRVVVLGRFDTTAGNPIGGLYDRKEFEVSPLYRTYFFKDGAVEIFEHVADGLRASGLTVLKDYAGHAEPALLEAPLRAKNPVLVTATVTHLQHDQIREKDDVGDYEAGRVSVDLKVTDTDGKVKLQKSFTVFGRTRYDEGRTEFLKLLGWKLAETLAADPELVAAIGAQAKG
jgi:hypothetical protein